MKLNRLMLSIAFTFIFPLKFSSKSISLFGCNFSHKWFQDILLCSQNCLYVDVLMNHGCFDFLNKYLPCRKWLPEDLRMGFRNRKRKFVTTFLLVVFREQLTEIPFREIKFFQDLLVGPIRVSSVCWDCVTHVATGFLGHIAKSSYL